MDFSKAFNRVSHNIVVRKLIDIVDSSILPTICSFLSNRLHVTKVDGVLSEERHVTCGVPQGTKLGPLLFLTLVNDLLADYPYTWNSYLTVPQYQNKKINVNEWLY